MPSDDVLWYKDSVFYELHVKAFQDGNGDGIGDFRGLISRLDYLQDLGVDCIWLLPFYPSPLRDDGYDIADYMGVHPHYGTLEDVHHFVEESHRRGIRIIADLVLNHTSDQHSWFQRARRAPKGSPERDWYVWSDTDEPYPGARIIFTDAEPSNWSWDSVAGQYYWHRFFSHQPDLNWDNPEVKEAMFQVMEFWLDVGLDGFRADAVPYLIEREGTSCENLPETHAILREFRARLNRNYPGRILLAEANQWPDDVRPYFGESDEFHMAFHFPLMPRIFMAVRQGIRQPIVEIIERTPAIPDACQWCMFLRNHDELTLEMVTDDERDYMYQEYAADPRMRLNLGIRRRLAPLMENDRRKIELLNSILLTMPGTPIIYYGDEIGMGDNIYLGDRDGVRTPMQWSPDRNAGFSRAEPERLYLPVISDSVYGYQAVNASAQRRSPFSLLNWMTRLIHARKGHRALGRGSIEFLRPANKHVLAYLREHDGDVVLIVSNLSASAQAVQLDLTRFEGCVPVELLGATEFLPIESTPYALTLSPYGFYWFALRPVREEQPLDEERIAELAREWAAADAEVLADTGAFTEMLGEISPEWLSAQRWFRGKSREIATVAGIDAAVAHAGRGPVLVIAIIRVGYVEGYPEYYVLPLTLRPPIGSTDAAPIVNIAAQSRDISLFDALEDPGAALAMLRLIEDGVDLEPNIGLLRFRKGPSYERFTGSVRDVRRIDAEQSNTSVVFGETAILKVFRKLEAGVNPDLELTRYLRQTAGFESTPDLMGSVELVALDGVTASVAVLTRFVPNRGDAWSFTLKSLNRFFNAASRSAADPLSRSGRAALRRMAGDYFAAAEALGRLTGELHNALGTAPEDEPDIVPQEITADDVRHWLEKARNGAEVTLEEVGRRLDVIPGAFPAGIHNQLAALVRESPELRQRLEELRRLESGGLRKIRIHGDYHLGQVLRSRHPNRTGGEWIVFDFEGEPGRRLDERRARYSPLRDVAGMLRSFDYAVQVSIRDFGTDDFMLRNALRAWGGAWMEATRNAFVDGYRSVVTDPGLAPSDPADFHAVLTAFELEKAIYELGYELNSRPDWLWIPLQGIVSICERQQ